MVYYIPWFFFSKDNFLKSYNKKLNLKSIYFFTLYPFFLIRKFFNILINLKKLSHINFNILIKASCINSFKLSEIYLYNELGVKNWQVLSQLIPNSLSSNYHSYTRGFLNYSCKEATELLKDKRRTHLFTPNEWRPPYLFINKKQRFFNNKPQWLFESIKTNGLIVKPNDSCAGKGILKLYWDGNKIILSSSNHKKYNSITKKGNNFPTIEQIISIWKSEFKRNSDLLIMPILENKKGFPIAASSVVFRVITKQRDEDSIFVDSEWIEVPLSHKKLAIFNFNGKNLPYIYNLNYFEENIFKDWENYLLRKNINQIIYNLNSSSIILHKKLPKIDTVAWDWIVSDNNIYLLEGNSSYGLFIPQSFKLMDNIN